MTAKRGEEYRQGAPVLKAASFTPEKEGAAGKETQRQKRTVWQVCSGHLHVGSPARLLVGWRRSFLTGLSLLSFTVYGPWAPVHSQPLLPEIRISAANQVPSCATPERLMAFLKARNPSLHPRFENIAAWYQHYGERLRVRWDYAFFQMLIETNFLSYRRGDGRMGDVDPGQNNFAGIGTTGGGVPGDRFPDVKTGVLAQIQHLVAYSGERVSDPVAARTRLKQDDIISASSKLGRPVRFSDLARRWAVDRRYGQSIEWVATRFRETYCQGPAVPKPTVAEAERLPWAPPEFFAWSAATAVTVAPAPRPAARLAAVKVQKAPAPPPAARAPEPRKDACSVNTASYGGKRTFLIQWTAGETTHYTALTVLEGFEESMMAKYVRAKAPGGQKIGTFPTPEAALNRARQLCPSS